MTIHTKPTHLLTIDFSRFYGSPAEPGTMREKLFGDGPYLPKTHPADGYRDIDAVKRRESEAVPNLKTVGA